MNNKTFLSEMFHHNYFNFISLITVLAGNRKIGRLVVSKKECSMISHYLKSINVKFEHISRSMTKDAFDFEGGKNNYRSTRNDIKENKERNIYMYISKDQEIINGLKESEINGYEDDSGKLLGYPKCCIDNYISLTQKGYLSDTSLLKKTFANTNTKNNFPFYTNFGSYGRTLILHFPCNYNCKESIANGKQNFRLINNISKKFGQYIHFCLTRPTFLIKYSGIKRTDHLSTSLSEDYLVTFKEDNPIIDKSYYEFEFVANGIDATKVILINKKTIKINNKIYKGDLIYFNNKNNN